MFSLVFVFFSSFLLHFLIFCKFRDFTLKKTHVEFIRNRYIAYTIYLCVLRVLFWKTLILFLFSVLEVASCFLKVKILATAMLQM